MLRTALLTALASSVVATLPAQNCFDLNIGTDLLLTDDGVAAALPLGFTFNFGGVAYTDICVCSNGFIWLGPTSSGGDFSPSTAELLSNPPRICPLWTDMNPSAVGSGHVYYNTIPGVSATITWAGVFEFGGTNAIEMQMVLDAANNITITYGANAPIGGSLGPSVICGASPGGGAAANPISFATRPIVIGQDTFHEELVTPGPFPQFSSFQMTWTPTTPGYVASDNVCTINSFPAPANFELVGTGCPPLFNPGLNASDDSTHLVTLPFPFLHSNGTVYNDIYVSSNGFFVFGNANPGSGCCSGSNTTLLAGAPRVAGFWQDLNCSDVSTSGNGDVETYTDPVSGDFVIDWVNVGEFGDTTPAANNFQIALSAAGDIKIRYLNVAITSATRVALCGYSVGGGAIDPGSTDLSALVAPTADTVYELFSNATPNPIDLSGLNYLLLPGAPGSGQYTVLPGAGGTYTNNTSPAVFPLTLDSTTLPQVGGTMSIDVSNIASAPNGNIVILLISTEIPALDVSFLGLTGCTALISLPEIASFTNLVFGASPTTSFSVPIPNSPVFYGVQVMSQAVSDDATANPFGFSVSNGGRWTLGL
ncbi:MAG: hypothetical protein AB7O97_02630 [Planctomycetota bacterium]